MSDSGSECGAWDIEKYRVEYESEEHWELRKVETNFLIYSFDSQHSCSM